MPWLETTKNLPGLFCRIDGRNAFPIDSEAIWD